MAGILRTSAAKFGTNLRSIENELPEPTPA